jgi:hypothetical protein
VRRARSRSHEHPKRVRHVVATVASVDVVEVDDRDRGDVSPHEVPRTEVAVDNDVVVPERVVVATQQTHRGSNLFVRESDTHWRVADLRMHLAAVDEGLAFDPAEDVAPLIVHAQPTRGSIEGDSLEVEENVAHQSRPIRRWPSDGVADAHDATGHRTATKRNLVVPSHDR